MRPAIIYLIGPPAVGKYTIACELARMREAVVIDNHLINHPLVALFKWDGKSKLPAGLLARTAPIRAAILSTLEDLAPRSMSYVFTNALEDTEEALELFERIAQVTRTRRSVFVPVELTCSLDEQLRRVVSPERSERGKLADPAHARDYMRNTSFLSPDHENGLQVDTSALPPAEAAERILGHVDSLGPFSG